MDYTIIQQEVGNIVFIIDVKDFIN